jgi:hypothetical protein
VLRLPQALRLALLLPLVAANAASTRNRRFPCARQPKTRGCGVMLHQRGARTRCPPRLDLGASNPKMAPQPPTSAPTEVPAAAGPPSHRRPRRRRSDASPAAFPRSSPRGRSGAPGEAALDDRARPRTRSSGVGRARGAPEPPPSGRRSDYHRSIDVLLRGLGDSAIDRPAEAGRSRIGACSSPIPPRQFRP